MKKIQVTEEELQALDIYKSIELKSGIAGGIAYYIKHNHAWNGTYLPLKQMGFEKFVKCLVQGYELEFELSFSSKFKTVRNRYIEVKYNFHSTDRLKVEKSPIYLHLTEAHSALSIPETKQLINNLQQQLNHLKIIRSDI